MIGGSILYLWLAGLDMGTAAEQLLNGMYTSYILLAVPLFIFAAEIMNSGSMTERLLLFCDALVGRFRGGLAQVNVLQSIIFAGMSGSAIADAAGSGKLMQTMMTSGGKYTPSFAAALTAASAVIGPIIPPSIPMVVYALVADASIGYLFIAGIVPGLLMGGAQMAIIAITARRRKFPVGERIPVRELPRITVRAFPALMMPVVLLGFIYSGVTTPTEAAAIAAAYAFLISALLYREVTVRGTYASLLSSARTTASIGMLIAGAMVFNYVVTVENIPQSLSALLEGRDLSPAGYLVLVNLLLLVLGCLLEGTTILLVIVPVLIPTAEALGIDLVHFGVVVVVNIMLGLITPALRPAAFHHDQDLRRPAPRHRSRHPALPLRDAGRARADHLRAGGRALASPPPRLPRMMPMSRPIHVLNGPNLNRLGLREPEIYGRTTLAEIEALCRDAAGDRPLVFRQSNFEGEIVGWIHEAIDAEAGILINPAGLSFTSIPILDALKMSPGPIIELHISNIHRREAIYHRSLVSTVATAVIAGLGARGYPTAVQCLDRTARRTRMK